jgi:hypothetical protein
VRRYYVDWFKTFADITGDLGGRAVGTQFAIFTYRDFDDPQRRADLIDTTIDCWAEVAAHARSAGLEFIFWEPMSIGREFGETIAGAMDLQVRLSAQEMSLPMWMMADIDHGDVTSATPEDFDPYAWARAVPRVSPIIHIKQSLMDKGGHRPFTAEFNAKGRIQPEPLLAALREGGAVDNEICLELGFKRRGRRRNAGRGPGGAWGPPDASRRRSARRRQPLRAERGQGRPGDRWRLGP